MQKQSKVTRFITFQSMGFHPQSFGRIEMRIIEIGLSRLRTWPQNGHGLEPKWLRTWTKMALDLNQNGYGLDPKRLRTWTQIGMHMNQNGYGLEPKLLRTWPQTTTDLNQNGYGLDPKRLRTWTKMATDLGQNGYGLEHILQPKAGFVCPWEGLHIH